LILIVNEKFLNKIPIVILCLVGYFIFVIDFTSILPIFLITFLALIFDFKRYDAISPVSAVSWMFFFTGLIGYLVSASKNSTLGTSFGYILPAEHRHSTYSLFSVSALSLLLGAAMISNNSDGRHLDILSISKLSRQPFVWIALLPLMGLLIGFTPKEFLIRDNHLLEPNIPLVARLSLALSIIAVPAIAIGGRLSGKVFKSLTFLSIVIYGVLYFSMSSRALAVIPISLIILFWPKSDRLKAIISTIVLPVASYTTLVIPLYLRSLNSNGLLPYIRGLMDFRFSADGASYAFQNFTVAFDLNGLTAYEMIRFPKRDFFIQVSPLLGEASGWYEIANAHRFNFATPTAALGELINYGLGYSVTLLFLIGLLLSIMNKRISTWKLSYRSFGTVILYSGSLYFGVLCLQYNLRSAVRIIYYLVALVFLIDFLVKRKNLSSPSLAIQSY
jgi:hypothetical protein